MATSRLVILSLLTACAEKEPLSTASVDEADLYDPDVATPAPEAELPATIAELAPAKELKAEPMRALEKSKDDRQFDVDEESLDMLGAAGDAKPMQGLAASATRGRAAGKLGARAQAPMTTGAPYASQNIVASPPPMEPPDEPVANNEEYTDSGVNPFTLVSEDPLSTFSIDVDTASYSLMRRKLLGGEIPAWQGVRAEEFINYFDYGYKSPATEPFAVSMEAMPDPFRAGHQILRVGVQGREIPEAERPTVHLTFLVDVSGSMSSPDKLPLAQRSLHLLVDRLQESDTVALCTYAGGVARILEPTPASNKAEIHSAIERLESGGSTAMSSGIDLAYELADQAFETGAENRVIILSDGDANVGATAWETMLGQIKGYADKGVTLTTVGFGVGNYRDTLMEQLANKGDGTNVYIDDETQAQRVFVEETAGTLITIARDVKIQVDFNSESVSAYRLIGYENRDIRDQDFRNDRVDAGEVGSGHNVTALYDVMLKDGYTRQLATVRVRYEKPGADGTAMERSFPFQDSALKETTALASHATRIAYTAGTFAEILRQSPHASEISLKSLASFARQASREGNADDKELVDLIVRADSLMGGGVATN